MNKMLRFLILAATAGMLLPLTTSARDEQGHFYFKGDLGGNVTEDTELEGFFGPVSPGSKVEFDPGIRVGLHAGYNLTDWFAAEAEFGIMENWIHSITDASQVDAFFSNVPFLVNAKFQWPNRSRLIPYIGGGVGVSAAVLDVDWIDLGGVSLTGTESAAVFAYQAFAGLRYKLNDRLGVSVEYRYFATESPEWEADFTEGTPSDRVRFGHIQTHAVSLAADFTF